VDSCDDGRVVVPLLVLAAATLVLALGLLAYSLAVIAARADAATARAVADERARLDQDGAPSTDWRQSEHSGVQPY
jgi:hypothetical protein